MNETYINISFMSYQKNPDSGRIFTTNKAIQLDLHVDVPYEQAKREMAKLMLRTGKMPDVIGKNDGTDSIMYMLSAFLA